MVPLPGVPPHFASDPADDVGLSKETSASVAAEGAADEAELVADEDVQELGDDALVEEVEEPAAAVAPVPPVAPPSASGAFLGVTDGAAPLRLGADSAPLPPIPDEPTGATALDAAIAEATAGDWAGAAAKLAAELAEVEASGDRERVAQVAYELGELTERRLHDEAGAVKSFGRALQSDPSLRPNLWAIRRVFYRRGLWPNLLKLIDAEVRFARSDAERADLLVEKAQVIEDKIAGASASGDLAGAREAYDKAIALDPTHRSALLGRERIALTEGDHEALLRVWRCLADATEVAGRKVGYLIDAARLVATLALSGPASDRQAALEEAQDIIAEATALGASPGVDAGLIARERERLSEMGGDAETILAALEARIALLGEGRAREAVALRRRQSRVALGRGDSERARRALEQAASLAPDDPLILSDLVDLADETGDAAGLATALERLTAVEGAVGPARELYLAQRRALALDAAGRGEEAEALRDRVAEKAPGYLPFLERAERQALRQGDAAMLAGLRVDESAAARAGNAFGPGAAASPDPAWAAAALVAAGDLYALDVDRADLAQEAYEQALAAVPGFAPAAEALVALHLRAGDLGAAAEAIERELAGSTGATGGARAEELLERLANLHERRGEAARAAAALAQLATHRPDDAPLHLRLAELHASAGDHAARVPLLEGLAAVAPDAASKAALLFEVGRVHEEHLGAVDAALDAYRRALELDPQDRTVRGALLALLRASERWDELAAELVGEAALADGAGAARALRTAAAVLERRLGRLADAATLYRELLDRAPDDAAALRGLARALAARPEELAVVLEHEAGAQTGAAAGQTHVRLGDLTDALGRPEDALGAYTRADAEGGVGLHARLALLDLAARRADRPALAQAYAALAERTDDPAVRARLLEEVAWLSDDLDRAAELFTDVARATEDAPGPLLGRALVAARRKDASALATAVEAQAEKTSDPRVAAALLLRAATLAEVGAGSGSDAGSLALRALALCPDDVGALVATAERPGAGGDERAAILERRAALVDDAEARALDELARAEAAAGAGRLAEAGRVLAGILTTLPGHLPALALLRDLARHAGDHETEAAAAVQLGRAYLDPGRAAAELAHAAGLLEETLGRPGDAGALWRETFALDPSHPTAFTRAHAILTGAKDAGGLRDLLSRRIRSLGPSAEVVPHLLERARLLRAAGDRAAAAADLGAILDLEPPHLDALWLLSEVHEEDGDREEAAALLRQHNEAVSDPERRAQGERRLAELLHRLGDDAGAIDAMDIVLTARPDDIAARERRVELLLATGQAARAAEDLEQLASQRADSAARARDELRAGRLFRDRAHDATRARRALERAHAAVPNDLDALRELCDLLVGPERTALLAEAAVTIGTRLDGTAAPVRALALVAALGDDHQRAHVTAGALATLGVATDDERKVLAAERQRAAERPLRARRALTEEEWAGRVAHPGVRGLLADAWAALADSAARAGEVDPAALGFGRGERIAARAVAKQAPAVENAQRLLGLGEVDLYVTAARTTFARAIGLESPIVLLSADVARAETLEARALLGRTLAAARLRSAPLEDFGAVDLAILLAAGLRVAGADPARSPALAERVSGQAARVEERVRLLSRTLGRKEKKALAAVAERLGAADLDAWITAVRATHRRGGLLLSGDVPLVLGRIEPADPLARDLVGYALAEPTLELRKELGL
jgi:tetratricopeptide (TPR) repeat protein